MLGVNGSLPRHDDVLWRNGNENPPQPFSPSHEVEANKMAAEIIMPSDAVRAAYNPSTDNVNDLIRKFNVSRPAMEIRLRSLGLR